MQMANGLASLNPNDYSGGNQLKHEYIVRQLGGSLLSQGFVILEDSYMSRDLLNNFYGVTAELLDQSLTARLKEFAFVKEWIDRGYVSSPSGAFKPIYVSLFMLKMRTASLPGTCSSEAYGGNCCI